MLKIGFADYFLNNWHADNYPQFLREIIARYGYDARVTHAFGIHNEPPHRGLTAETLVAPHNIITAL